MINKFLKAKHWEVFILMFVIPLGLQFSPGLALACYLPKTGNPGTGLIVVVSSIMGMAFLLSVATYFGWFWSIASGLQAQIPQAVRLSLKRFKALLIFPAVYITGFFLFMSFAASSIRSNPDVILYALPIILPLHFLAIASIFYCLYFVSKTIKLAELKRNVTFGEFIGEFFMIWFYPVGIWFLQPKLNQLAK